MRLRKIHVIMFMAFAGFLPARTVFSHCEIPCGIYDDEIRMKMIEENITTIEKSMNEINELSAQNEKNFNQIVRWVQNKEKHADDLCHIVTQYFMTQRLKPVAKEESGAYEEYVNKLALLHQMLVYSMKAKQTTDLSNVEKLRELAASFKSAR